MLSLTLLPTVISNYSIEVDEQLPYTASIKGEKI